MDARPRGGKTFKLIACDVLYREACYLAATGRHRVDVEFLRKGLHDLETPDMVARIQSAVDAVEADEVNYDAILLGYARCNDGVVGVTARQTPLVIPRAHDCITLFFGSREAYREYFDAHPGSYYLTTGWAERDRGPEGQTVTGAYGVDGVLARLGLGESYQELVDKHGKDNAEYIIETMGGWEKAYHTLCYLEMGICDEQPFLDAAAELAESKHWTLERRRGSLSLLARLLGGDWDEDFLIVQPGQSIAPRNDERIVEQEPSDKD